MKRAVLTLIIAIFVIAGFTGCNNKSKVMEKYYYPPQIKKLMYIENDEIKYTTEMTEEEYTILTEDHKGNKTRHTVSEKYYNELQVGDVYYEK